MNDPFVHKEAEIWASAVAKANATPTGRVVAMYRAAFSRDPTATETEACLEFVKRQAESFKAHPNDMRPWADLAHVLINSKEFVYLF
jgi:hypothetical protein